MLTAIQFGIKMLTVFFKQIINTVSNSSVLLRNTKLNTKEGQLRFVLCTSRKLMEGLRLQHHSFLILVLDGELSGQPQAPAELSPSKKPPGNHSIGERAGNNTNQRFGK